MKPWCCTLIIMYLAVVPQAAFADLKAALGLPDIDSPWGIDAFVEGTRVVMQFPRDINLLSSMRVEVASELRQRMIYRERNLPIFLNGVQHLEDMLGAIHFQQTPEYQRQMNHVVLALHPNDAQLPDPLYRHRPVLEKLPSYTHIDLFVPDFMVDAVTEQCRTLNIMQRTTLHAVPVWATRENGILIKHSTTRWARDLFLVAQDAKGKAYVLAPPARMQTSDLSRSDTDYLQLLRTENRDVVTVPMFFQGGNLLLGESDQRWLLIGQDEFKNNANAFYSTIMSFTPDVEEMEMLRRLAGVSDVFKLPNTVHMFHLDMAMVFLDKDVVGLLDPLDPDGLDQADLDMLREIKIVMEGLGFKIVKIPTTSAWVSTFRSPANAVPFVDRETGRRKVLIPQYQDVTVQVKGKMQSLNTLIEQAYASAGYQPVFVEDRFYTDNGNIHCAVMVID